MTPTGRLLRWLAWIGFIATAVGLVTAFVMLVLADAGYWDFAKVWLAECLVAIGVVTWRIAATFPAGERAWARTYSAMVLVGICAVGFAFLHAYTPLPDCGIPRCPDPPAPCHCHSLAYLLVILAAVVLEIVLAIALIFQAAASAFGRRT